MDKFCNICKSTGHNTGDCCYCGSHTHTKEDCRIAQKAKLLLMGVPPEHLFDVIMEQKEK